MIGQFILPTLQLQESIAVWHKKNKWLPNILKLISSSRSQVVQTLPVVIECQNVSAPVAMANEWRLSRVEIQLYLESPISFSLSYLLPVSFYFSEIIQHTIQPLLYSETNFCELVLFRTALPFLLMLFVFSRISLTLVTYYKL